MRILLKNKLLIVLICLFVFVVAFYLLREYMASKEKYTESYLRDEEYYMVPKTYGVNEYSVTKISDQDMSKIYLNDYIYNINQNKETAYNLLNEEYRNEKFGSLENFINYINSNNFSNILTSYSRNSILGKVIYVAYDSYGNVYIFKTNGVMQYEVYLDDYTVEI